MRFPAAGLAANKGITDALGTQDTEQDPGDEGDSDSEAAA